MAHKGRTALITGACGGLGRVIAENFLADGANVVVCDINKDLIADFNEKVASKYPEHTLVLPIDITSDAALDDLFKQAEEKFGPIHYAVNNCGIMDKFDPAGEVDRSLWDRVIAVNLTAPAMVIQRAVKSFLKHGTKGAIVNIASTAGLHGFQAGAAYTASKHGLLGLTKNTGVFYGPKGIRCNAILAGAMQTNIGSSLANGYNEEGIGILMGRYPPQTTPYVELPKMAKLVSYLCSDDAADFVNGACWTADRGWTVN